MDSKIYSKIYKILSTFKCKTHRYIRA